MAEMNLNNQSVCMLWLDIITLTQNYFINIVLIYSNCYVRGALDHINAKTVVLKTETFLYQLKKKHHLSYMPL